MMVGLVDTYLESNPAECFDKRDLGNVSILCYVCSVWFPEVVGTPITVPLN